MYWHFFFISLFSFFLIVKLDESTVEQKKKVLVFLPITGHSHLKFMGTIANILQDEGYNVTLLMPLIDYTLNETIPIVRKVKHHIRVDIDHRVLRAINLLGGVKSREQTWTISSGIHGFIPISHLLSDLYSYTCDNIFHSPELLERLANENFEIGLSEPFFVCGFALFDHLGMKKIISIDSHIGLEAPKIAHGMEMTTSFLPAAFSEGSDQMTFMERTMNLYESWLNRKFALLIHNKEMKGMKGIYTKKDTWEEIMRLPAYMFTNSNPLLDFPYARTPKFIEIGGIAADEKKIEEKLSEEYNEILNRRCRNVLISFGSNAKSIFMPKEMRESFISALSSIPDTTFIWKYENITVDVVKEFNSSIDNIVLVKWMPQQSLLADPRLNLFVTHGGMASTNEVAFSGKPSVMVPIFGDQTRNSRMLERHGTAIVLRKEELKFPETVKEVILKVLEDSKIKEKAERLAEILNNQPESPQEVFLKYFNFVAKYGKPDGIDSRVVQVSFVAYYHIDLLLFLFVSIFFVLFLITKTYRLFAFRSNKLFKID